ncbi:MAG: hypothetical protein M3Y87_06915 [Myxococcota bacterium]|nr:hypothetical protein [Myxococcota bacterium]
MPFTRMPTTRMKALAEALAEALAPIAGGRVLWVGAEPIETIDAARGTNRASIDALPPGDHDAAVIGPCAPALLEGVRAVRACVREGGVLALALPIEREGFRAVTQRALATFDAAQRPRALEEACAALLSAGVQRVQVIEVKGARGLAVVHGVLSSHSSPA